MISRGTALESSAYQKDSEPSPMKKPQSKNSLLKSSQSWRMQTYRFKEPEGGQLKETLTEKLQDIS